MHQLIESSWSNLAQVVYKRTYSRKDNGYLENWKQTWDRAIKGNIRGFDVSQTEINRLEYFGYNRKAMCGGRGLWFSGSPGHERFGGAALNNCWGLAGDKWKNLVIAADLLMLGGGVGMSVEHRFVSKLPRVKRDVKIVHRKAKDTYFIVPDSREGWCDIVYLVLKSYFLTGKSFDYSTILIRGKGEKIKGFGGVASGPAPLIKCIEKMCAILDTRGGKMVRPIDMADLICCIAEMVIAGNVRRSALIVIGDCFDKEFLYAKRWDKGTLPSQRGNANFSVVCDDIEDLHPAFWQSYEIGEPIGIINRTNMRKFGRMGEEKRDPCMLVNPCAEANMVSGEPCNLQEEVLPNLRDEEEFVESAVLMHRWGKRVTCEKYHHKITQAVVNRYRRIGTGITGCLQSPLFNPKTLDRVYKAIQKENMRYSKELGIPPSIKTTVIKPSGTLSKMCDVQGEGIHPAYSSYWIQTIRFSSDDPLIPILQAAGHLIEPEIKLDGSLDHGTSVVYFYYKAQDGMPVADDNCDTWQQLENLKMAQKYWADQSVSITVYYKKEDISKIKEWLSENLSEIKTISFLCHKDHGFKQAPKQAISEEEYYKATENIKPLDLSKIKGGFEIEGGECNGGVCPIK